MAVNVLSLLPIILILVPLALHFVLVNFVLISTLGWLPLTYLFSHLFLFIAGQWSIQEKEGLIPIIVFIFVVAVTILMDIVQLGLYFGDAEDKYGDGDSTDNRTWQFSAGMMIINLIGKPITIALACLAAYFRSGRSIPGLNLGGGGGGSDSYQPVQGSGGN